MVPTKSLYQDEYYIEKMKNFLKQFEIFSDDVSHFLLAFVHRSLVNERPDFSPEHNERLEFLGDAVLELIITNKLFDDFPQKPEGELTDYRSAIVKGKHLANVAKKLSFHEMLILGKGEEKSGGRTKEYILANTLEAFIGAIYLTIGYTKAKEFVLYYIYTDLEQIILSQEIKDYKSLIQEFTQMKFNITPNYKLLGEEGLDHDKTYTSGIYLKDFCIGKGEGGSKKRSQEDAAKYAYLHKENIILP